MTGRRLPAGGGDERGEPLCSGAAHAWQQVLIGVHRERRVGVTEAFGHDLDRGAVGDEQRGVGVAQVVEPNPWQAAALHDAVAQSISTLRRLVRVLVPTRQDGRRRPAGCVTPTGGSGRR